MKREMEDIYLSYAEPEQYRLITNKLKATQKDREKLMAEFIEPLKVKLSEAGIQYKLKIRTKAAYSIWAKMVKQKVPFEGVFDVFAIRFIIDCPDDLKLERELCWKVFGFVTEEYEQDTRRLRDWVTNPKWALVSCGRRGRRADADDAVPRVHVQARGRVHLARPRRSRVRPVRPALHFWDGRPDSAPPRVRSGQSPPLPQLLPFLQ